MGSSLLLLTVYSLTPLQYTESQPTAVEFNHCETVLQIVIYSLNVIMTGDLCLHGAVIFKSTFVVSCCATVKIYQLRAVCQQPSIILDLMLLDSFFILEQQNNSLKRWIRRTALIALLQILIYGDKKIFFWIADCEVHRDAKLFSKNRREGRSYFGKCIVESTGIHKLKFSNSLLWILFALPFKTV